jgi:hypothetical protein
VSLPFPNVPNLPGVPQIPRQPGVVIPAIIAFTGAPLSNILQSATEQVEAWGVFDSNGNQVVAPDSVVDFGNSNSWDVANFPVQAGSFAAYNKVVVPFEAMVRMTKGGSVSDRATFLQQIAAIAGDTNLYTIMTPEQAYPDVNVTRYENQRRGAAGAYFLDVDVYFIQIIQVAAQYTSTTLNAADPTAQPATNQGTVQAQPVTPQASAALAIAPQDD